MSFRLVPKSVTLNDLERRNGRYFALFQRMFMYYVAVKQLLGLHRFQNLLLIVYDHINYDLRDYSASIWANRSDRRPNWVLWVYVNRLLIICID